MVTDLVKIVNFQLVLLVAHKVFELESWNFKGMLVSMSCCAPGCLVADSSSNGGVMAPDLVKIVRPDLVSRVAPKVVELESWNFIGMLVCMSCCAHGCWLQIYLVVAELWPPALVKIVNFQFVSHVAQNIFELVMLLYRNVGQQELLCTYVFGCGFIQ